MKKKSANLLLIVRVAQLEQLHNYTICQHKARLNSFALLRPGKLTPSLMRAQFYRLLSQLCYRV